jgi:prepilin-type N-terminal cleavage/methylation domain-containing protein
MKSTKNFTLTELLVVIAILAVLMSLFVPSLQSAIFDAKLRKCAFKLKNTVLGITMYSEDNFGYYPVAESSTSSNRRSFVWERPDKPLGKGGLSSYYGQPEKYCTVAIDPFRCETGYEQATKLNSLSKTWGSTYSFYFGVSIFNFSEKMIKQGDMFTFKQWKAPDSPYFNVITSDVFLKWGDFTMTNHVKKGGVENWDGYTSPLKLRTYSKNTYTNYALDDGSVHTFDYYEKYFKSGDNHPDRSFHIPEKLGMQ